MNKIKTAGLACVLIVAPFASASAGSCFQASKWRNISSIGNAYASVRARTDADPRISRQSWQGRAWREREKGRAVSLSKAYQSLWNKLSVREGTVVNIEFAEISGKRKVTCRLTFVQGMNASGKPSKVMVKPMVCGAPDLVICKRSYRYSKKKREGDFQYDMTLKTSLVKTGVN